MKLISTFGPILQTSGRSAYVPIRIWNHKGGKCYAQTSFKWSSHTNSECIWKIFRIKTILPTENYPFWNSDEANHFLECKCRSIMDLSFFLRQRTKPWIHQCTKVSYPVWGINVTMGFFESFGLYLEMSCIYKDFS